MEQNLVHEDDHEPDDLEPSDIHEEYAPVILTQDTNSHVIIIDVFFGKVNFLFWYYGLLY